MCWLVIINPVDSTIQNMKSQGLINTLHLYQPKLWEVPIFPQARDRASKMRARVKITPREKGETRWGEGDLIFLSPHLVSPFLRGVIFTRTSVSLAHLLSQRKNGDYSQSNVTKLTWTTFMKISIIVLQLSSIYYLYMPNDRPLIEINSLKLFWPSWVRQSQCCSCLTFQPLHKAANCK